MINIQTELVIKKKETVSNVRALKHVKSDNI